MLDFSNFIDTNHKKRFIEKAKNISTSEINQKLKLLNNIIKKENISKKEIQKIIKEIVSTYQFS